MFYLVAGRRSCKSRKFRHAETTILIKIAFWRGSGRGKLRENCCFFLGNSMTIKFGKLANFIVRKIVAISEALEIREEFPQNVEIF